MYTLKVVWKKNEETHFLCEKWTQILISWLLTCFENALTRSCAWCPSLLGEKQEDSWVSDICTKHCIYMAILFTVFSSKSLWITRQGVSRTTWCYHVQETLSILLGTGLFQETNSRVNYTGCQLLSHLSNNKWRQYRPNTIFLLQHNLLHECYFPKLVWRKVVGKEADKV